MNKVYVLTTKDEYDVSVEVFTNKDEAIEFAMEFMFGEDWEFQMEDDDWEEQGELLDAYDALVAGIDYTCKKSKETWELHEVIVDEQVHR